MKIVAKLFFELASIYEAMIDHAILRPLVCAKARFDYFYVITNS